MALPVFTLLQSSRSIKAPGKLVWKGRKGSTPRVYQRRYRIRQGHVILTTWKGKLHEVIYQTPLDDEASVINRNTELFKQYGDGEKWKEILDNGFGKTYRRSDKQCYALWSYAMDFNTFGTMEFHEIKWQ
jgi:hypothetical protein